MRKLVRLIASLLASVPGMGRLLEAGAVMPVAIKTSIVSRGIGKKIDGYILYAHAYGLLQHDFVREYLLLLSGMMAHHATRGSWTATEVREVDPKGGSFPFATPAQLVVPLMTKWMLVFEKLFDRQPRPL